MGQGGRLEQVQVLRGLAALCVFIFHLGVTLDRMTPVDIRPFVHWGNVGVDLFFVISGFVMAHSVRDLHGPLPAALFLVRRLRRVAPLLYVLTPVFLAVALVRGQSFDPARIINCFTILPVMPSPHQYQYALIPAWTLGYELAFYLIVAGVVALGIRWRLTTIAIVICAFPFLVPAGPFADTLMIEFAFGVGAYALWRRTAISPSAAVLALGAATLLFALPLGDSRFLAFGLPSALLFVAFLSWNPSGILRKAGAWLGSISYSMYLSHTISFMLLAPAAALLPFAGAVLMLGGGGVLMSWLIFEAAEAPLQRFRFRIGAAPAAPAAA
jgi:exopolysaccharide production protein ExoZ